MVLGTGTVSRLPCDGARSQRRLYHLAGTLPSHDSCGISASYSLLHPIHLPVGKLYSSRPATHVVRADVLCPAHGGSESSQNARPRSARHCGAHGVRRLTLTRTLTLTRAPLARAAPSAVWVWSCRPSGGGQPPCHSMSVHAAVCSRCLPHAVEQDIVMCSVVTADEARNIAAVI